MIKKTFDALKYNTYNEKYTKASHLLECEKQRKAECEDKLSQLEKLNETKVKFQCFRRAFSRYSDVLYTALQRWQEYTKYKRVITVRIGHRLTFLHKTRANDSFQKWRTFSINKRINELKKINDEVVNDNSLIAHDIKKLDEKHKVLMDLAQHVKEMKLERCCNLTMRRFQKNYLQRWNKCAQIIQAKEAAALMLERIETKHNLRQGVRLWKESVKEDKRNKYINNFLENQEKYKSIQMKNRVFETLQRYARNQTKAKANVKRVLVRWQRNLETKAFAQWKVFNHKSRIQKINSHIVELDSEHEHNTKEISDLNDKIENTLAYNSHLSERLLTQAKRTMCNTFIRCCNLQTAHCFSVWKDTLVHTKEKETKLRSVLSHMNKKAQWGYFRKWTIAIFELKKAELETKIDMQITENAGIKKHIDKEEEEYMLTIERLQTEREKLEKEKQRHKAQYYNAIRILGTKMQNNVNVDKRRMILVTWLNFVKKERTMCDRLFGILNRRVKAD